MNELGIHTLIQSRYKVFDASGQLPFSIVFGLCRRSPADTDPRPLLLEAAGSILDVPYALTHDLLILQEQDSAGAKQWVEVNLNGLNKVAAKGTDCLSLPSPVNRTEHWRDAFTIYQCRIAVNGELASMLKPGKKYRIKLASENLGVKRWAYRDGQQFVDNDEMSNHDSEAVKLINSKSTAGNATFTLVTSLSWPPRMETRMRLCAFPSLADSAPNATPSSGTALEISTTNTGSDPVTVQTRGHQRFLIPWGPFQPEPDTIDDRLRIIDAAPHKPPTSSLQVIDSATGEVVRKNEQRGTGPLTDSTVDQRPKAEDVTTLKPGAPIIRRIDIEPLMNGLADGHYKIRMQPKGCRWWHGEVGTEADGRISAHLCEIISPPLMLESPDEVELWIRGGKVYESMQDASS